MDIEGKVHYRELFDLAIQATTRSGFDPSETGFAIIVQKYVQIMFRR